MVRISSNLVALLTFAATASVAHVNAALTTRATGCDKLNYGPFNLYASPAETGELLPLGLVADPPSTNPGIFVSNSTLSVCSAESCDQQPIQWILTNGGISIVRNGLSTVNLPIKSNFPVKFVTSEGGRRPSPDYCTVPNPDTPDGLPVYLAGPGGNAEEFTICSKGSTLDPSRQDVWYQASPEKSCKKVHLVMKLSGELSVSK